MTSEYIIRHLAVFTTIILVNVISSLFYFEGTMFVMYENIRVVTSITVLSFLLWKVIGIYSNSNSFNI
jgi:hypothetical protein